MSDLRDTPLQAPGTPAAIATVVLHVQPKFGQVRLERHGQSQACSLKTALFELQRAGRDLADIVLVDLDGARFGAGGPCSLQGRAILEALLASGLPDRAFLLAKGR